MAGDAHDDAARYSGFFLQGAEGTTCGVSGDVLFDAGDVGACGEVDIGGGCGEIARELAVVFLEDLEGEVGKGHLQGVFGFFLNETDVHAAWAKGYDLEAMRLPIGMSDAGLGGEYEPVAGYDGAVGETGVAVALRAVIGGQVVECDGHEAVDIFGCEGGGEGIAGERDFDLFEDGLFGPSFGEGVGKEYFEVVEVFSGGAVEVLVGPAAW